MTLICNIMHKKRLLFHFDDRFAFGMKCWLGGKIDEAAGPEIIAS